MFVKSLFVRLLLVFPGVKVHRDQFKSHLTVKAEIFTSAPSGFVLRPGTPFEAFSGTGG